MERYAQDVEATVYFCVLEALQNVQKYASAAEVVLRLRGDATTLTFEVNDDGAGFDVTTVRKGAGTHQHERSRGRTRRHCRGRISLRGWHAHSRPIARTASDDGDCLSVIECQVLLALHVPVWPFALST